jgi:RND family efflux transporter MFP subunit
MNKASLLSELQIDRRSGSDPGGSSARIWWIIGIVLVALAAAGALAWFLIAQPGRTPVAVATAQTAAASGGAVQGASLLDASGYVVARRQATVSSKITGKVTDVLIEEGQHVKAGQVIARLDDSNARAGFAQAQAQAQSTQANLQLAQVQVAEAGPKWKRNQQIHASGYLSDQGVEDAKMAYDTANANLELAQRQVRVGQAGLEVARRNLDDTVVRAPFDGVVTVKAAQPGEIVSPISAGGGFTRTGICTIVDMDSLEVEVDVAESFINRVSDGMPATVKLNAYPDWQIPAYVIAVIPTADRSKATVTVRVGMKAKDARVVPEMGARVSFLAPAEQQGPAQAPAARSVVVPADAVQADGDQPIVYVVSDGKAERRAVKLGAKTDAGQILLSGVSQGEQVALGGKGLHDGSAVRIVKKPPSEG